MMTMTLRDAKKNLSFAANNGRSIDFVDAMNEKIKNVLHNMEDGNMIIRWTNRSSWKSHILTFFGQDDDPLVLSKEDGCWYWTPTPLNYYGVRDDTNINDIIAHDLSYEIESYAYNDYDDRDGGERFYSLYVPENGQLKKVVLFRNGCLADKDDGYWEINWRSNGSPTAHEFIEFVSEHIDVCYKLAHKMYAHNTRLDRDEYFRSWEDFKNYILSQEQ